MHVLDYEQTDSFHLTQPHMKTRQNRQTNRQTRRYNNICICSAQSENRYNSGNVLRKVGILTLSGEVGILTLRRAVPELLVRKVGIGTK